MITCFDEAVAKPQTVPQDPRDLARQQLLAVGDVLAARIESNGNFSDHEGTAHLASALCEVHRTACGLRRFEQFERYEM